MIVNYRIIKQDNPKEKENFIIEWSHEDSGVWHYDSRHHTQELAENALSVLVKKHDVKFWVPFEIVMTISINRKNQMYEIID